MRACPSRIPRALQGQIAAVRASIATQRADAQRTIEYARQALSRLPSSEPFMRSLAAFNLGDAYLLTGDVVPASAAFADAVDLSLATGSLHMVAVSSAYLARTQMLRGRLREAERVCQRALNLVAEVSEAPARTVPTLGMLYAYLGHLRRELDDLDGAGRYLGQALELGEQSGYVEVLAATYWALAQLHRAQADVQAGLAMIERAIETVQEQSLTVMRRLLLAERADLLVALARLEEAESWAREHRVGEVADFGLPDERECLSLVRLRLARGEVAEAVKPAGASPGPRRGRRALRGRDRDPGAPGAGPAREWQAGAGAERPGTGAGPGRAGGLRPHVRGSRRADGHAAPPGGRARGRRLYVARLLAAIQGAGDREPAVSGREGSATRPQPPEPLPPGVEPLTAREVEVLRLLAGGASNQRIADELTVSVGTVKAHISHILGKIGAHNRTEAVARARELGLSRSRLTPQIRLSTDDSQPVYAFSQEAWAGYFLSR